MNFKIAALTLELAYYRRIKFGKTSEALSGEQRELFKETVNTDLAAIVAELPAPDASRCQPTCRASNTALSRHRVNGSRAWSRSVKISADSLTSSQRVSSCTVTSARSTLAEPARPSLQHRCLPRSLKAAWPHRVCWAG